MENASKALAMAGGILLGLMVLGALMLMVNQISDYEKANTDSEKSSQIALFNQDFTKYSEEKELKGTDIISLINKVIDYNQKEGTGNYVDYEKKITLEIDLTGFAQKYGVDNQSRLFGRVTNFSITNSTNNFAKVITKFSTIEKKYTLITMGKLKSNYLNLSNGTKTVEQVTGKTIPEFDNIDEIAKYIEYTELKSSTFEPVGTPIYDEGQIIQLSFKYVEED